MVIANEFNKKFNRCQIVKTWKYSFVDVTLEKYADYHLANLRNYGRIL
jgi:hypothetical protein